MMKFKEVLPVRAKCALKHAVVLLMLYFAIKLAGTMTSCPRIQTSGKIQIMALFIAKKSGPKLLS